MCVTEFTCPYTMKPFAKKLFLSTQICLNCKVPSAELGIPDMQFI